MSTIKSGILRQFISEALSRGIIVEDNGNTRFDLKKWEKWIQNNKDEKIKGEPLKKLLAISQLLQKQGGSQSKKISLPAPGADINQSRLSQADQDLYDLSEDILSSIEKYAGDHSLTTIDPTSKKRILDKAVLNLVIKYFNDHQTKDLDKKIKEIYYQIKDIDNKKPRIKIVRYMQSSLNKSLNDFSDVEGIYITAVFDKLLEKNKLISYNKESNLQEKRSR